MRSVGSMAQTEELMGGEIPIEPPSRDENSSVASKNNEMLEYNWLENDDNFEDVDDDDDDVVEEGERQMEIYRHRLLFLLVLLGGTVILFTPALLVWHLTPFKSIFDRMERKVDMYTEIVRWSLYLTSCWIATFLLYLVVQCLPSAIRIIWRRPSKLLARKIESFKNIKEYLPAVLASLFYAGVFHIFFPKVIQSEDYLLLGVVSRLLWSFFVAMVLRLIKGILIHLIAVNFHRLALEDRIKESEYALGVLEKLSEPSLQRIPSCGESFLISSRAEARKLAKRIFRVLVGFKRRTDPFTPQYVEVTDFYPYFSEIDEAEEAYRLFDTEGLGNITYRELRFKVLEIYRNKKFIRKTLRDMSDVIKSVDWFLFVAWVILAVLVTLCIFGQDIMSGFLAFGSLLVALSFIFGTSASEAFEGLIFLFVMHPYDIGDRVFIDDMNLVVKDLRILSTVFVRSDGHEIHMSNRELKSKRIHNIRRSPGMTEVIDIHVDFWTPREKLDKLKSKMEEFLLENHRVYMTTLDVQFYLFENSNRMTLQLYLGFNSNWHDNAARWDNRNRFMMYLRDLMLDLGITYFPPVQPIKIMDEMPPSSMNGLSERIPEKDRT